MYKNVKYFKPTNRFKLSYECIINELGKVYRICRVTESQRKQLPNLTPLKISSCFVWHKNWLYSKKYTILHSHKTYTK